MKTFAQKVLAALPSKGLDYADVRVTGQLSEFISTKNGSVEAVTKSSDSGFGLRVLVNGAWGFASSSRLETAEIRKVVRDAIEIAKASGLTKVEKV
ncbi:MAG: DNA gyrase modulator, partial [bacterium]|nr:DNA gyrase modulator [bacterium]